MFAEKKFGIICIAMELLPAERRETGGSEGDQDEIGKTEHYYVGRDFKRRCKGWGWRQQRIRSSNSSTLSFVDAKRFLFCINATQLKNCCQPSRK